MFARKKRKNSRKKGVSRRIIFIARLFISSLSIRLRRYIAPKRRDRNITARPSDRFMYVVYRDRSKASSSPPNPPSHVGLTRPLSEFVTIENSLPVKSVATTTPSSIVAPKPFIIRNASYVELPRRLSALERNSYDTACIMKQKRMSIHTQYAPPKLVA